MRIDISDLFFLYEKNGSKVVALRGMHLQVESGECLVVKGPNGSGKSTLVRLLSGFLRPSAGFIYFDGQDISKIDPLQLRRQYISTIDQKGNLLPELSALENVALALTLAGATRTNSLANALKLLVDHDLAYLSQLTPSQLSSGERQMCSVLAALASGPKILIADEPSGELDNQSADRVYNLLRSSAGETTVILVTHDSRAEKYADRIVRVRDGRISAEWLPGDDESAVVDPFGWMQVVATEPHRKVNMQARGSHVSNDEPLVRLENICLSYGNREILRNFSLEARPGDFIAITGPSASGKSSLLRIICGIQDATTGSAYLFNQKLSDLTRKERADLRKVTASFLSQGDSPVESLSIQEYFLPIKSVHLEDLENQSDRHLSEFSGGERARIEICKMLSLQRRLVVFDEPTSQLDDKQSAKIAELLLEHARSGGVVITSTRDEYLLSCASQVLRLDYS